jgi:O-antigen/teichoic acid export membrane protein
LRGGSELRQILIKGASGSFALKVSNAGLRFLMSLLLARLLGASGFGAYSLALAWAGILSIPAMLGFDRLLIREISVYRSRSEWGLMKGVLTRTSQAALGASLLLALAMGAVAWALSGRLEPQVLYSLWVAAALVPLMSLSRLRQGALRGMQHVVSGQFPEQLLRPLLFILFIGVGYLLLNDDLSAPVAVGLNAAAVAFALLVVAVFLRRNLPRETREAEPSYRSRLWLSSAIPLIFVAGAQVINVRADIIMVGAIAGAREAGIYTVASRGAELVGFVLMAANAALGPVFASLYNSDDLERLQRLVTRSVRLIFLAALPIAVALIVFGNWFMLLFGEEFVRGDLALALLSVGRLISTAAGPVAILLLMPGNERRAAVGVGIGPALNIGLNAALIPSLGIEGAAISTASSTVIWNLLLAVFVYRRLGIHPTVLGRLNMRRRI